MPRHFITQYRPAYKHLDEIRDDMACLDCWLDSMEYDIKNYLGEDKWKNLRGFMDSLIQNFVYVDSILQMIIHKEEEIQK